MTEIEKKALALVNEACRTEFKDLGLTYRNNILDALLLAIEQHEAYKQEVSDAAEQAVAFLGRQTDAHPRGQQAISLARFIIQPVDPLVEAFDAVWPGIDKAMVEALRTALAARGGRIVFDQPEGGAA